MSLLKTMRSTNVGWLFNKYDFQNRVVYTGWMPSNVSSEDRDILQTQRSAQTSNLSEAKIATASDITVNGVAFRYTNQAWPTGNSWHVLSVNYYDDYNFPGAPTDFSDVEGQTVYYNLSNKPRGFETGSWTRVLEATNLTAGELSHTLYDSKGRPIKYYTSNYLGGETKLNVKLDFAGTTHYTVKTHKRTSADTPLIIRQDYTYSDQGRLISHTHKINSNPAEIMSENQYDELGTIIGSSIGGTAGTNLPLQKVNYSYTVRGWLKEVNKIASLVQSGDPADLFAFKIAYHQPESAETLFNGNISETYWRTASDNKLRRHAYQYDGMGRLTSTLYQKPGGIEAPNSYGESQNYDKNGNIRTLARFGEFDDAVTALMIDELDYSYEPNSNSLAKVTDHTNNPHGFTDDSDGSNDTQDDYGYDINGNIKSDQNKGILKIVYNHLDFPTKITLNSGAIIEYIYSSTGNKVRKIVTDSPRPINTQDYQDDVIYSNGTLEIISTTEGYAKYTAGSFNYAYNYVDHLGNVRLTYGRDPSTQVVKVMEESNYYPMGLKHRNYNMTERAYIKNGVGIILDAPCATCPIPYKYNFKFNGQELQEELRTNIYDMPFRDYDPSIGRWTGIDPVTHYDKSPYNGHDNNPAFWSDPSGADVNFWSGGFSATGADAQSLFNALGFALSGYDTIFSISGNITNIEQVFLPEFVIESNNPRGWWGFGQESLVQHSVYSHNGGGYYDYYWKDVRSKKWDSFQGTMEVVGAIDPTGVVDGLNAAGYALRGQKANAIISAIGIIPYIGDLAKVGKRTRIFEVGAHNTIKGVEKGLDAHHVGQQAVMKKLVPGYNPRTAPSILVPKAGHTIGSPVVSRRTAGFTNARQVLARDIFELRKVYPNVPNGSLQQLIEMNKSMYPQAFIKP